MQVYSYRTESYFKSWDKLDSECRLGAERAFKKWACEARDGMSGRKLHTDHSVVSVKMSEGYRSVGTLVEGPSPGTVAVVWFFVGKHSDYEHMLKSQRLSGSLARVGDKLNLYKDLMKKGCGLVRIKESPTVH